MKILIYALLIAAPVFSAENAAPPRLTRAPYWFRTYSLNPIKEHWTVEMGVKNLEKDLPRVLAAFAKEGAVMPIPLGNMVSSKSEKSQQLRYRLSLAAARKIHKRLGKLGRPGTLEMRPEAERPHMPEVLDKIERLVELKRTRQAELAKMEDASSIVDELLEHLLLVEHSQKDVGSEVLWNLTVKQIP